MENHLHIISFDVPYPPDYGGVIDVFYKIKALSERGVKIHLHCFEYGREPADVLKKLCHRVSYYKREKSLFDFIGSSPYIIKSRRSEKLINNILQDDYPILMEGLHSCFYLDDKRLSDRKKTVRMHNVEQVYYKKLAETESNPIKKIYFSSEAVKLETFEKKLQNASAIAAISASDAEFYRKQFNKVEIISAFHSDNKLNITPGQGEYVLYHGNLSVGENHLAALFLIKEIFSKIKIPFIIAGNKPSAALLWAAGKYDHIRVIDNFSTEKITDLIRNSHINILPTFQATGIKLKLLSALHNGRFCLVNSTMVEGTGLEKYCIIKDTPEAIRQEIQRLMNIVFSEEEIKAREEILTGTFSNDYNTDKLIQMLF